MAQILVQTRARAIEQMMVAARRRGANAILGMRFDNRDITSTWVEIVAYGTAVVAVAVTAEAQHQQDVATGADRRPDNRGAYGRPVDNRGAHRRATEPEQAN